METVIQEVLPKAGLVYSEKGNLSEVLCKPKIMALKSVTLEKIEAMEKQAAKPPTPPAADTWSGAGAGSSETWAAE